jgi:hypothetical protein
VPTSMSRRACRAATSFLLTIPAEGHAWTQETPRVGQQITAAPSTPGSVLSISLTPSRSQLTAGGTIGITGLLTNTSKDSTVYFTQGSVFLTQAPELEGPMTGIRRWTAFLPGESQGQWKGDTWEQISDDSIVVALKPGQSTVVGWTPVRYYSVATDSAMTVGRFLRQTIEQILNESRFLFFSPGDYQMTVGAKYWLNPRRDARNYHTAHQSIVVHIGAPQFVILLGAMIGGFVAYLIFPSRRTAEVKTESSTTSWVKISRATRAIFAVQKRVGTAFGAMLWSAIATILLSRLSDTQFLVKVTVADFWGAIAIGLVAQYVGSRWLERLIGGPVGEQPAKPVGEQPAKPVGEQPAKPVGKR